MSSKSDYALAWMDLRRRRRINWGLWLGYFPVGALVIVMHSWLEQQFRFSLLFPMIMLPWFFAMAVAPIYLFLFRCPRCKNRFDFRFGSTRLPWAQSCAHCGLKVGTLYDPGVDEEFVCRLTQADKKTKRFSRIFLIVSVTVLVAIALITSVAKQRLKEPQAATDQFMQRVQKNDFRGAYELFSSDGRQRLKPDKLQKLWRTFKVEHGSVRSWKYSGSYNLPLSSVSMAYRLQSEKGKEKFLRIDLRKMGEEWLIQSIALQDEVRAASKSSS